MKQIIEKSLKSAKSYQEYKEMVVRLLEEGKNTGAVQSESLLAYTKLNNQRMKRLDKKLTLTEATKNKAQNINRELTWLVLTEGWCGDAAQSLPVINKLAEASEHIDLKIVLRDENEELMDQFLTNGSRSIPKLVVLDKEKNEVLSSWGPRSYSPAKMIKDYKEEKGQLDAEIKKELQLWYNKNKGLEIENELLNLIDSSDRA